MIGEILVSIPVLGLSLIIQTVMLSRLNLLAGSADLFLVILAAWGLQERVQSAWYWAGLAGVLVGFVSGLPWPVPMVGYLVTVGAARLIRRRIWQAPLLAVFIVTLVGTLVYHMISYGVLRLGGDPLPFGDSFTLITLPSVLLNLLLAIPIYSLIHDLASWIHPQRLTD